MRAFAFLPFIVIPLIGVGDHVAAPAVEETVFVLSAAESLMEVPADMASEALPDCGWCHCCDENCEQLMAMAHENGISEVSFCQTEVCDLPAECQPSEQDDEEQEEVLTLAAFAQVWNAALLGDVDALHEALIQYPSQVHYNATRGSVQVVRCGTYVANIPLSDEQRRALVAAE